MRARGSCCEEYRRNRTEDNYRRYIRVLELLSVLAVFFLLRSALFFDVEFSVFPSYATVYTGILVLCLVFRVLLTGLYKKGNHAPLGSAIILVTALILFFMANLCLLDSFVISDVEFTAFIFGTFMVAFLLRTEWYISLILFLSSMIYYIAAYYALRHELFNIPSLLPLGPITFLAFYFSWTRENMNRKLFQTGYELAESNRRLIEQSRRDALTGLHNRRHMEDFLAHQTALYRRRKTPLFSDLCRHRSFQAGQ